MAKAMVVKPGNSWARVRRPNVRAQLGPPQPASLPWARTWGPARDALGDSPGHLPLPTMLNALGMWSSARSGPTPVAGADVIVLSVLAPGILHGGLWGPLSEVFAAQIPVWHL